MALQPETFGIHHITLRSMSLDCIKKFYSSIIGFPLVIDSPDLLIFQAGSVYVTVKQADPRDKSFTGFSPFKVEQDHIALCCASIEELHRFAKGLENAGVENTGAKTNETFNKLYVVFKDPDLIKWEFYMA